MLDQQKMVKSCVDHINQAKSDIESFNRTVSADQRVKQELELAYNSLNDTINHVNTALKHLS